MRQPHFEKGSPRHVIRRQPARLLALTGLGPIFLALFASAATPAPATHEGLAAAETPFAGPIPAGATLLADHVLGSPGRGRGRT